MAFRSILRVIPYEVHDEFVKDIHHNPRNGEQEHVIIWKVRQGATNEDQAPFPKETFALLPRQVLSESLNHKIPNGLQANSHPKRQTQILNEEGPLDTT